MKKIVKDTDIFCDKNLSLDAKGLYFIIHNNIPPFDCTKYILQSFCNNSESEIQSALSELVAFDYLTKDYLECFIGKYDNK